MLVFPGPPINLPSQPSCAPGLQFAPSRGAKPFQYVCDSDSGTPLSPGNTNPVGVTPAASQAPAPPPNVANSGSSGVIVHGYIVEFCPGRKVCTLCPISFSG